MARSSEPARLALQTGRLDDRRRHITPGDELWDSACRRFFFRDDIDSPHRSDDLRALCERWPSAEGAAGKSEALAVTVALASPFADRERILRALLRPSVPAGTVGRSDPGAPILISPWLVPRPGFPYVYDPDTEERAPIIAVLDGPRSRDVAELLETIKKQDETLADAIVLGADLETLESLNRLSLDAKRADRGGLAAQVEQDRERWRRRAEQARARQRLEGPHYGWHGDNFPPGCLEAVRAELRHDVEVQLEHLPAPPSG